jgi:thioredoxin 1
MKTTFQHLINQKTPVLVDFYADWCGPCKMQTPILESVAKQLDGKAKIIKVDVDKNQSAATKYQVNSIPTLILFKDGDIKWRQAGVANENQLLKVIKEQL